MESWKGNRTPSNPQEGYYVGLMNACGYRTKDLEKPVIGIVNSFTDVNPGHRAFKELVGYVKEGVWAAGGTPAEFNVPAPCDGKAVRCYRSYSLRRGDALLALGRTQWAVLGPEKKLMPFAQTGFPADFPFSDRTGITDHPTRFADDLTQAELVRGYTVRPTDIDFGRHMNNVAYVRVLLDCFSAAELASGRIASMEVHYAAPCLEGEELGVYCRREESGCRLAIKKADGKAAVLAAVKLR